MNVFDVLKERGFIEQCTHENEIREMLGKERVTFYIGFDPTADSLTAGHFLTVVAMAHMQRAGHTPIALVGGGTGMVGDPSGKTDMRKMMTKEIIANNVASIKKQLSKFIDFSDNKAYLVDNGDWLCNLNYLDFLREYGVHFSVNRMLTADCFKTRMEKGLTFLEFNYMIMQSYDFLELNRRFGCKLELGGNDQWSNILGGVELIRRVDSKDAFGMTFSLLVTSEGKKMGKTEAGTVWLDPLKTAPYDFFQYWRNVEDVSVIKLLRLLTFLPMEEIKEYEKLKDNEINRAKEVLAYELTKMVHGEEEAEEARTAARALFSGGISGGSIPTTEFETSEIENGIDLITLLEKCKLIPSRAEGRRLIQQGGIKINDTKIDAIDKKITLDDFVSGTLMIQKGKKTYHQGVIK